MPAKNQNFLVVDASNFFHTCYWPAASANQADQKYDIESVFKVNLEQKLDTIHRVLAESGITSFRTVFVEDRKPLTKLEIFPLYKANREKVEWAFNPKEVGKAYLTQKYPSTIWAHSPDSEADDVIASFIAGFPKEVQFVVASSDKDLWQLAAPNVRIFRLTSNRFLEPDDVEKEFRTFHTYLIPLYKTLWGDSGDNVPNLVPRMQKNLMPMLELTDGSVESFWRTYESFRGNLTQRCQELVDTNKAALAVNWALVKLKADLPVVLEDANATSTPDATPERGEG